MLSHYSVTHSMWPSKQHTFSGTSVSPVPANKSPVSRASPAKRSRDRGWNFVNVYLKLAHMKI